MPSSPRVVVLTPPGRGAVATVRIVGPGAAAIVAQGLWIGRGATPAELPLDGIRYGRWGSSTGQVDESLRDSRSRLGETRPRAATGEEVVVCRRPADEETIDIHCHGGTAAVRAIVRSLVERGAREVAPWGHESLSWRTTLGGPADAISCEIDAPPPASAVQAASDLIALQAQAALAEAPTLRTAAILLDQWGGALSREIQRIEQLLAAGDNDQASQRLQALIGRTSLGLHLTTPWRVVLAGAPNVGKSSLINALLGYQRSIVFDQPGTTRDVVTAPAALDGWPVELTDTAGLRAVGAADIEGGDEHNAADDLEAAGIGKALDQAAAADLVVLVLDAAQPLGAGVIELVRRWPSALVVLNKYDLLATEPAAAAHSSLPFEDEKQACAAVRTSALTGEGIELLGRTIAARLVPDAPPPGAAVPFTARQVGLLESALAAMRQAERDAASMHLQFLLARKVE